MLIVGGGAVFLAVYGALLAAGAPGLVLRGLLFNIGPITAMALAPHTLRRARGRQRWGWATVAGLAVCWFIAEAIYSVYELCGAEAPFPGAADLSITSATSRSSPRCRCFRRPTGG